MKSLVLAAGSTFALIAALTLRPSPRPEVVGARHPLFLGSVVVSATPLPATVAPAR